MNILVTGGTGYIGSSVVNHLISNGHTVKYPSRKQCDFVNNNSVNTYFSLYNFDFVIHCASDGRNYLNYKNTSLYNNIIMLYNILENKQKYNKLLTFGSGGQYRGLENIDPYDLSKRVIFDIVDKYEFLYCIDIWNIFDQNQRQTRFIKSNLKRYINKQPMIVYNDMKFDFFHMKDFLNIVNTYIDGINTHKHSYCAYNNKRSLVEISNYINTLSDYTVPIYINKQEVLQDYTSELRCDYDNLYFYIKKTYDIIKEGQ